MDNVREILADPEFVVPPVPSARDGVGWFRATCARFSSGDDHARRRALAVAMLPLDVTALRRNAFERTKALHGPIDFMAQVARVVPVEVLAEAIGLPAAVSADVVAVARVLHPHADVPAAADAALARLVAACGGVRDEEAAARIGLLVQACDATAGLAGNAVFALLRNPAQTVETVLAEVLRDNPPVRATRRQSTTTGQLVTLDFAAANRGPGEPVTFGAGPKACPGRHHALALAAGTVEAVRGRRLVEPGLEYEPSPNLRVPARLLLD